MRLKGPHDGEALNRLEPMPCRPDASMVSYWLQSVLEAPMGKVEDFWRRFHEVVGTSRPWLRPAVVTT